MPPLPASAASPSPLANFPLDDPTGGIFNLSAETIERWCRWFIILGLVARCVRYFVRFPLWEDECFVCYNYLDRDFMGLTEKLDFPPQIAPIFYLWSQLAVVRTLGFNEWSLRLTAFLVSIASVYLFARLAKQILTGVPRLFAVATFAVSYVGIRYSAEAKQYGMDLFVALLMITLTINWLTSNGRFRDLVLLLAALPVMMGFSFPAVFVGGGLVLFAATALGRNGSRPLWLGLTAFTAILVVSFGAFYVLSIRQRMETDLTRMQGFWNHSFPPIDRPWLIPFWLIKTHASDLTAYPAGGPMFCSSLSFIAWIIGIVGLVRRRHGQFLVFVLAPLALTFVAAALQKYPYGGHFKFNLYLAPTMCLVLGYGAALTYAAIARRFAPDYVVRAFLLALASVAVITSARDLYSPYKSLGDHQYRAFAQWFWPEQELVAEVACCKRDFNLDVSPKTYDGLNFAAVYLCNRAIYSPRARKREPLAWDKITDQRPLVCVLYRDPWMPFDDAKLNGWLHEMSSKYRLETRTTLPHHRKDHTGRHLICAAYLEVFRFTPLPAAVAGR